MQKILFGFVLVSLLVLPLIGLIPQPASAASALESCKLRYDLGKRLCDDADKLAKGCTVSFSTAATKSYCDDDCSATQSITCKDASVVCLINFVYVVGDWIFAVLVAIAIIMLLLAGFQFVTAGGAPEAVMQARTKIIYGVVGLAVAFLAKVIIKVIETIVA